jgi:hypothetical protein
VADLGGPRSNDLGRRSGVRGGGDALPALQLHAGSTTSLTLTSPRSCVGSRSQLMRRRRSRQRTVLEYSKTSCNAARSRLTWTLVEEAPLPPPMDEWSSLAAQVQNASEDLRGANAAAAALCGGSSDAQTRAGGRLQDEASRLNVTRRSLRLAVSQRDRELGALWEDFRFFRRDVDALSAECLAIRQGAWARETDPAARLCFLADTLVRYLAKAVRVSWDVVTVPSGTEFYGYLASVIRVRCPDAGVWSLPITAHEFGHYVTPKLELRQLDGVVRQERYPFQALLDERQDQSRAWSILHEQIADAFATYALGLAYPYACVVLRFNPGHRPYNDGARHPGDAKRLALMLRVLENVDAHDVAGVKVARRAKGLHDVWERSLAGAQQPLELEPEQEEETLATADKLSELLFNCVPGAAYSGLADAQEFAGRLCRDAAAAVPRRPLDIADVLNAAWIARIDAWDAPRDLTEPIATRAAQMLSNQALVAA